MAARLYGWLVRLHPPAFRERFGAEMLCVYDEAQRGERPGLWLDGVASLARQWVARTGYWIVGVAALGALLQLALAGTAWLGAARQALDRSLPALSGQDPSAQDGVLLLGAGLVCAVLLLITAVASLVHTAARRKS